MMSINRTRCVVLTCAGCGVAYHDEDTGSETHLASVRDAHDVAVANGWSLAGVIGGWDVRCLDCASRTDRQAPVRTGPCVVYCVSVTCDRCGEAYEDYDDSVRHWGDVVQAYNRVREADWFAAGDRALCGQCIAVLGCELLSHSWGDWHPIATGSYAGQTRT